MAMHATVFYLVIKDCFFRHLPEKTICLSFCPQMFCSNILPILPYSRWGNVGERVIWVILILKLSEALILIVKKMTVSVTFESSATIKFFSSCKLPHLWKNLQSKYSCCNIATSSYCNFLQSSKISPVKPKLISYT